MNECTIVTYYSYKGGVGRTFALANTAALLAQWGYRVLCIDWDLEAPGLHLYFRPWMESLPHQGLVEFLTQFAKQKETNWQDYLHPVQLPDCRGQLSLLAAGNQEPTQRSAYLQKMQAIHWNTLYTKHDLGNHLEKIREQWKEQFDFVFIDSRTGITDHSGICTAQLPDILVLLSTLNQQNFDGLQQITKSIQELRNHLPFDRAQLLMLPVVARFESRVEYELTEAWLDRFAKEFAYLFANWAHQSLEPRQILQHTRIPHIPYWNLGERLPVVEKGTDDPEDLGHTFETLASLLARRLAQTDQLVTDRDLYVKSVPRFRKIRVPGSFQTSWPPRISTNRPPRVFISYSHDSPEHSQRVRALADRLRLEGGCDAWIDQYTSIPSEGWSSWFESQIGTAQRVLIVCTETYQRRFLLERETGVSSGVNFGRGFIINQNIHNEGGKQNKFRAVLLDEAIPHYIPSFLRDYPYYRPDDPIDFEKLVRWIHERPSVDAPPIGPPPAYLVNNHKKS